MKKIAYVTTTASTIQAFVLPLARDVRAKLGYDITFICAPNDQFAAAVPPTMRFLPVPMQRGFSLGGLTAWSRLMRIFRHERFDLVQYSTPNAAFYAALAARASRTPRRVYAQWGIRYVGLTGAARYLGKQLEKITCACSTQIRAASAQNLEFARRAGLVKPNQGKVIGAGGTIGVDLTRFDLRRKDGWRAETRQRLGLGDDFVFGFVGRMTRDKGAHELLHAFREIATTHPVKLLCVGPPDMGFHDELVAWGRTTQNIVFTGSVPPESIPAYYAAMDGLVHPSYREGFGLVLQEAGAMALPILTTDIPGASEVMEDERSCILVRARDVDRLEAGMRRLLQNPTLCENLGRAARQRTEMCYDRYRRLELLRADLVQLLET